MQTRHGNWMAALVLLVFGLGTIWADEEKVALDKLPAGVTKAIKTRFPKGKLVSATKEKEKGKTTYEVVVKNEDQTLEVTLTPEGKIEEIEKEIAAKDLPKAVTDALDAKYPKATIKKSVEISNPDKVAAYEVDLISADKKKIEIKLDPKGKILEEEEADKE